MLKITTAWHTETRPFKMVEMIFKVIRWVTVIAVIGALADKTNAIELHILFWVLGFLAWIAAGLQIAFVFMPIPDHRRSLWASVPTMLVGFSIGWAFILLIFKAAARLLTVLIQSAPT